MPLFRRIHPSLAVVLSVLALFLEPKEDKWLLIWVPFQRFFYRQLLYIAALRSFGRALTGRLTGWQKLTRTADVSIVTPAARYAHREVELQRVNKPQNLNQNKSGNLFQLTHPIPPDNHDQDS